MLFLALLLTSTASAESIDLSQKIDHYVQAHQRSQKALRDFDLELDAAIATGSPGLLRRSSSYRQLQALRALKHADAETIGEQMETMQAKDPQAALSLQHQIQSKLNSLSSPERESASALFADISSHHEELNDLIEEKFANLLQPKLQLGFDAPAPAIKLQLRPGLLDLEMAELTSDMDFSPVEPTDTDFEAAVGATPQLLAKIRPGTGPEGNITGSSFPVNTWALTFDDGPHPKYTQIALDTLRAHGKKATFFWLAQNVANKNNLSAISAARSAGMSLNDHSFTHADLNKPSANLAHEIKESADAETRIYGFRPEFFRLPYGSGVRNPTVRQMIANGKMIHVFWNVDSLDWQDKDPASILARVKKEMLLEKHGIILFHDIHPQSVATAKLLLDYSDTLNNTKQQIRWVTLPEIRDELNNK
jgi:peptidoglycan/xylan/chitin deacetylase (PgdA/CDA1 family)